MTMDSGDEVDETDIKPHSVQRRGRPASKKAPKKESRHALMGCNDVQMGSKVSFIYFLWFEQVWECKTPPKHPPDLYKPMLGRIRLVRKSIGNSIFSHFWNL